MEIMKIRAESIEGKKKRKSQNKNLFGRNQ